MVPTKSTFTPVVHGGNRGAGGAPMTPLLVISTATGLTSPRQPALAWSLSVTLADRMTLSSPTSSMGHLKMHGPQLPVRSCLKASSRRRHYSLTFKGNREKNVLKKKEQ